MTKRLTYREAGVDIQKAEDALLRVKAKIQQTFSARVLRGPGLFGGFYEFPKQDYREPVLVSSTDGVGTKLKVAILANRHDTIGQDLVNHCVNDIAVCGAEPLFFLDYFAAGKLEPAVFQAVMEGITRACRQAAIPLIGGETAEMPDFYQPGDYDVSGTIVGVVEKENIIDGQQITPGDVVLGVASNGLHTNGYSLARKVLLGHFRLEDYLPELQRTLVDELLRIHLNYYPFIKDVKQRAEVHGLAHITGGGIEGNTRRVLPKDCRLVIDWGRWEVPPIFQLIQSLGHVPDEDMRQTFNLGIGLVVIVGEKDVDAVKKVAEYHRLAIFEIGNVVKAE